MIKSVIIATISCVMSAFQQIVLKVGSEKNRGKSLFGQYFNIYILTEYSINVLCVLCMMYAFRVLPYNYIVIYNALGMVFVTVLGRMLLGESITKNKRIGICLIMAGIIIYAIN